LIVGVSVLKLSLERRRLWHNLKAHACPPLDGQK
jgi:hypothetical protein